MDLLELILTLRIARHQTFKLPPHFDQVGATTERERERERKRERWREMETDREVGRETCRDR